MKAIFLKGDVVENVTVLAANADVVRADDDSEVGVGWTRMGKSFVPPEEKPKPDNRVTSARIKAACELLVLQWDGVGDISLLKIGIAGIK